MNLGERVRSEPVPDLWPEIEQRVPTRPRIKRTTLVRGVSSIVAALLVASLLVWAATTLGELHRSSVSPAARLNAKIRVPSPQPLVAGEGAIWVVGGTGEANQLWRIDPSTNEARAISGTQGAWWPAVGNGWAWVTVCHPGKKTECASNDLLKIDPRSGDVAADIPLPGFGYAAYVGLGAAWVSTSDGLVRVDPSTDMATTFTVGTNFLGSANGYLWATESGGGGFQGVAKLDPVTGNVVQTVPFKDPCIFLATELAIWVASCQGGHPPGAGPDHLVRIDPSTGSVSYDVSLNPSGQLTFADGGLWIAHVMDSSTVVERIDPATGHVEGPSVRVEPGPRPWGVAGFAPPAIFTAASNGSFWLTHVDADDVVRVPIPQSSG